MIVRFWGVRGSFPAPGPDTARIGGNTPCVSVETDGHFLVLDAGTGIRALGEALAGGGSEITLLVTHLHWDHLMGLPFFAPLFEPGREIRIAPVPAADGARTPLEVLDGVHFPTHYRDLAAACHHLEDPSAFLADRGIVLTTCTLAHPGGSRGFRVETPAGSFVYMTDNELAESPEGSARFGAFAEFARGADLFCHDAQYTEGEISAKRGWGHSSVEEACRLAIAAGVEHLLLFHHDPVRSDDAVAELEVRARAALAPHGIRCTAAFEGLEVRLD